jgi:thiol-disulfide isomerase/thioredoxin
MRRPRKRIATSLLALAAVLALAACGDEGAGNPDSELSLSQATAPLEDGPPQLAAIRDQANEVIEGEAPTDFERRLEELRGTPVVVNKWASWCGPCRLEFPYFQNQAIERGEEVAFLGVLSDDSVDAGATFLEQLPLPYPSYYDPDKKIADLIDSRAFPATAFYDRSGELVFTRQGQYRDEQELAADIDRFAR